MNIFLLDKNPRLAAQYHCDKHVVKMITETAQIISTVLRSTGKYKNSFLYKPTHQHHPCVKFITPGLHPLANLHLSWLNRLLDNLLDEYDYRFEKHENFITARNIHILTAKHLALYCPEVLAFPTEPDWANWPLAMPDEFKTSDPVLSYQLYYIYDKKHLHKWTKRGIPRWLKEKQLELSL